MSSYLSCQRGPYEGIINYFFSKSKEKFLKVDVSSNHSDKTNPLYIIGQHDDLNHWASRNESNPWFEVTFAKNKITLNDYTLKSHQNNKFYMKSWKLDGSNDPINWHELHRVENSNDLANSSNKTYSVTSISKPYSHFRFTLIDPLNSA